MRKKILISISVFIILLSSLIIISNAKSLELKLKSSKEKIRVGEEIKITVDWVEGMQAADFYLRYDEEIFEFIKANIDKQYLKDEDGKVKIAWFSTKDEDKTNMEFKFKAISEGNGEFRTQINGGFATGNLDFPSNYKNNKIDIEVVKSNIFYKILIMVVMFIFIIIILKIIFSKKQRRKR